jgi:hypothetical protein
MRILDRYVGLLENKNRYLILPHACRLLCIDLIPISLSEEFLMPLNTSEIDMMPPMTRWTYSMWYEICVLCNVHLHWYSFTGSRKLFSYVSSIILIVITNAQFIAFLRVDSDEESSLIIPRNWPYLYHSQMRGSPSKIKALGMYKCFSWNHI